MRIACEHWAPAHHGEPSTSNVRRVTCDECRSRTDYLLAVVSGTAAAFTRAVSQLVDSLTPRSHPWPGFCPETRTQGGYVWACHLRAGHDGNDHMDRSRGTWRRIGGITGR